MKSELDLVSSADFGVRNQVRCVLSGMGKVNAAVATTRLIYEYGPDCIINAGVAGSLDSEIREGSVVVGAKTAYHDVWCGGESPLGMVEGFPQRFSAHPALLEAALGCAPGLYSGLIMIYTVWTNLMTSNLILTYKASISCIIESCLSKVTFCHLVGLIPGECKWLKDISLFLVLCFFFYCARIQTPSKFIVSICIRHCSICSCQIHACTKFVQHIEIVITGFRH